MLLLIFFDRNLNVFQIVVVCNGFVEEMPSALLGISLPRPMTKKFLVTTDRLSERIYALLTKELLEARICRLFYT